MALFWSPWETNFELFYRFVCLYDIIADRVQTDWLEVSVLWVCLQRKHVLGGHVAYQVRALLVFLNETGNNRRRGDVVSARSDALTGSLKVFVVGGLGRVGKPVGPWERVVERQSPGGPRPPHWRPGTHRNRKWRQLGERVVGWYTVVEHGKL